jgi:hypothetical protein
MRREEVYEELPREDEPSLMDGCQTYLIDGTIHVVFRDRLWRRTGQTHNPRVIAGADAVAWEGALLNVVPDGKTVILQHHQAGIRHRIPASARTKWCFVTFEEVTPFRQLRQVSRQCSTTTK